jgi:Ca2+-binding EF-hand superfamily protein
LSNANRQQAQKMSSDFLKKLDINNDGRITLDDLRMLLDKDGDNKVSWGELWGATRDAGEIVVSQFERLASDIVRTIEALSVPITLICGLVSD